MVHGRFLADRITYLPPSTVAVSDRPPCPRLHSHPDWHGPCCRYTLRHPLKEVSMQAHQDVGPMQRQFLKSATMLGAGLALGVAGESPALEAETGRRRVAEQPATSDGSGAAVAQSGEIPQRP